MSKKVLVLASVMLLLLLGGVFFIWSYFFKSETHAFSLIPRGSFMVLETNRAYESWEELKKLPMIENLNSIPQVERILKRVSYIDSLSGKDVFKNYLKNNNITFSIHAVNKSDVDALFFLPVKKSSEKEFLTTIITNISIQNKLSVEERKFQEVLITELIDRENKLTFSYIFYDGFMIGSYTGFLVEDVIRLISGEDIKGFLYENQQVLQANKIETDFANIYINYSFLSDFFGVFASPEDYEFYTSIAHYADYGIMDIDVQNKGVFMNGFTYSNDSTNYLSIFKNQKPASSSIKNLVSNSTGVFYQYTFSDHVSFVKNLNQYLLRYNKDALKRYDDLKSQYGEDFRKSILESLDGEYALASFGYESKNGKCVYLKLKKESTIENYLQSLISKIEETDQYTHYKEKVKSGVIYEVNIKELPSIVFGKHFSGFDRSFITFHEGYLLIANEADIIQKILQDIESDHVWAKTIATTEFLNLSMTEANISIFVNTAVYWNNLIGKLSPSFQPVAETYSGELKAFEMMSCQFSYISGRFYSNMILTYNDKKREIKQEIPVEQLYTIENNVSFIGTPLAIDAKKSLGEVLVQDSLLILHSYDSHGKEKWKFELEEGILDKINVVDINNDNKSEYIFITSHQLYLLDHAGKIAEHYPVSFSDTIDLKYLTVIDYDNSKNYRLMLTSFSGLLYLYDIKGNNLEGWSGLSIGSHAADRGRHARVAGKDFIFALSENGMLHAFKRRANLYDKFPVRVESLSSGPLYLDKGVNFEKSIAIFVTNKGELVKANFEGKLKEKKQLSRPSANTLYRLILDKKKENSYVISRINTSSVDILNSQLEVVFSVNAIQASQVNVDYYDFGEMIKFYVVTDKQQKNIQIYDAKGHKLLMKPIIGESTPDLLYDSDQKMLKVYYTNKSLCNVVKLVLQ